MADLSLDVSVDKPTATIGTTVVITLVVTNDGPDDASRFELSGKGEAEPAADDNSEKGRVNKPRLRVYKNLKTRYMKTKINLTLIALFFMGLNAEAQLMEKLKKELKKKDL